jgi:hypothetical protein
MVLRREWRWSNVSGLEMVGGEDIRDEGDCSEDEERCELS